MRLPPRRREERLIDWPLLVRAYLWLGVLEAVAAMAAFFFVLVRGGWEYGQMPGATDPLYLQATTACLAAIVVMQVANVFLCRSATRSVFATGLLGNALIILGVMLEIAFLLLINYTPWANSLLGTAPIGEEVRCCIPFAAGMFLLEELRKWLARRRLLKLFSQPRASPQDNCRKQTIAEATRFRHILRLIETVKRRAKRLAGCDFRRRDRGSSPWLS